MSRRRSEGGPLQVARVDRGYTEYTVSLMAKPNEPAKALADLKGRKLVTPDPDSITAGMVRAMLRTGNIAPTATSRS